MLETAILITGYIGVTACAAWIAYLVGHMAGAAEARARWFREAGRE